MQEISRREFVKLTLSLPLISSFAGCSWGDFGQKNSLEWTSINVCSDTMQGDAHLISKNSKHFLIDGGHPDLSHSHLLPFLESRKITHLDGAMINHPHRDHYGGFKALFEKGIKIDRLYMNMPLKEQMSVEWWGGSYQELEEIVKLANMNGTSVLPIKEGDKFLFDGQSSLEVLYIYDGLHTPVGATDINDMSAIVMIKDGANRFLLTGDLNEKLGGYLAQNAQNIKADVLKVPHHGTNTLAPNSFFERVAPKDIIVTAPKMLWCDVRSQRIRTLAKEKRYGTYVNGFQGDITVISDGKTYSITTQKEAAPLCEQISKDKGGSICTS